MRWPLRRRRPFRFYCPYCGNIFFHVRVGLARKDFDGPPAITSIREDLKCDDCGLVTGYQDFIDQHRGWL